jgi:uncharacterized protein (TIGR02270 family)
MSIILSEELLNIDEYIDELSFLWFQRCHAIHAPNYSTQQFADLDERLEAHIDGLRVAGDEGWQLAKSALENEGPEDFFPAAVLAIETADDRFDKLIEKVKDISEAIPGLVSALNWVSAEHLVGRVKSMLDDPMPFKQMLGIAACALHRKNPPNLEHYITSIEPKVRARSLRIAGELGRMDCLPLIRDCLADPKVEARFWATWSAVLLGDRSYALEALSAYAIKNGAHQMRAFQLTLLAMPPENGQTLLQQLPNSPDAERLRIIGAGYIGMIQAVPWLLEQMTLPQYARIAAEAFVNITGADFNLDQLEALPPEDYEDGPTDDPDDENVELPEDIALPWPDLEKIKLWWTKNQPRFQPNARYFFGSPVTREHCIHVLKEGFQRQRVMAAYQLCVLNPGSQLFPTAAPAWRQKELLDML